MNVDPRDVHKEEPFLTLHLQKQPCNTLRMKVSWKLFLAMNGSSYACWSRDLILGHFLFESQESHASYTFFISLAIPACTSHINTSWNLRRYSHNSGWKEGSNGMCDANNGSIVSCVLMSWAPNRLRDLDNRWIVKEEEHQNSVYNPRIQGVNLLSHEVKRQTGDRMMTMKCDSKVRRIPQKRRWNHNAAVNLSFSFRTLLRSFYHHMNPRKRSSRELEDGREKTHGTSPSCSGKPHVKTSVIQPRR